MNDLAQLFANDSIVKNLSEGATGYNYLQDDDEYLIFEKGREAFAYHCSKRATRQYFYY